MRVLDFDGLVTAATQRPVSLFADDVARNLQGSSEIYAGSRILVIGGAGSIGSATVRELARYDPVDLDIVDIDENGLAELVRDLRSSGALAANTTLRTNALDLGSTIMQRLLREREPYDHVLNFAAVKHVRSEKDSLSLLHMLDTNLVKPWRLLSWLDETSPAASYFAVSTDKAACPVNLMGASKRAMECMMFDAAVTRRVTSARFANVAFSNGSLLDSFLRRLNRRQPWAVPSDTKRFFISPREAGELCQLAAAHCPDRHLLVPRETENLGLRDLVTVAEDILAALELVPTFCEDEEEARSRVDSELGRGRYPVIVTKLNTMGEKEYEEFVAPEDVVVDIDLGSVLAVRSPSADSTELASFMRVIGEWVAAPETAVTRSDVAAVISRMVPNLDHRDSTQMLDDRI